LEICLIAVYYDVCVDMLTMGSAVLIQRVDMVLQNEAFPLEVGTPRRKMTMPDCPLMLSKWSATLYLVRCQEICG
jgi:hypothetical protein